MPSWGVTGEYYRYIDSNGSLVIDNDIPPELASKGYSVIDGHGRLLRKVAPRASDEDIQAAKLADQLESQRLEKKRKQDRYDLSLLRRYSFVSDIEAEKNRKFKELEVSISILKGNLIGVRSELEVEYERAAKIERSGRKPVQSLTDRITSLEEKITTTENMLNKRRAAKDIIGLEYQQAIDRFKELQAIRGRSR